MKFPTKVLALSLLCMNMVPAMLSSGFSKISKMSKQIKLIPNLVRNTQALAQQKPLSELLLKTAEYLAPAQQKLTPNSLTKAPRNSEISYGINIGMTPEDIKKSREYEKLVEACEELNELLESEKIANFTEIPSETATKVDSAVDNALKLILPKGNLYSAKYWINKIIENPEDDYEGSEVKKILLNTNDYTDSMDVGLCDFAAPDMLYSLTPYLNGKKKSNIDARSVFGQMMLKLTTKEKLKKTALRMIFASFFSGTRESDYFLNEYGLETNPKTWYNAIQQDPNKYLTYGIYFEDKKLKRFIEDVKDHYIYIYMYY